MTMIKRPTGKLCGSIPKRGGYNGRKKGISELLNIDIYFRRDESGISGGIN